MSATWEHTKIFRRFTEFSICRPSQYMFVALFCYVPGRYKNYGYQIVTLVKRKVSYPRDFNEHEFLSKDK